MFIITHTKRTSINTDYIRAIEIMQSENKMPCVAAITDNGKQIVLAEYATEEDCKTAMEILSGAVNFKQPIMFVPSAQQMRKANDATYTFSGKHSIVVFNNMVPGDTATFAFPDTAPVKGYTGREYASYKVTIFNEANHRGAKFFGMTETPSGLMKPGVSEFYIVYDYSKEEWKIVRYSIVPYVEEEV